MHSSIMDRRPRALQQIESLAAESSEGVILFDDAQRLRWANAAALCIHGVTRVAELGQTRAAYEARFNVVTRTPASGANGFAAAPRDGLTDTDEVDITPPYGGPTRRLCRTRTVVESSEDGEVRWLSLVIITPADSAQGSRNMNRFDYSPSSDNNARMTGGAVAGAHADSLRRLIGIGASQAAASDSDRASLSPPSRVRSPLAVDDRSAAFTSETSAHVDFLDPHVLDSARTAAFRAAATVPGYAMGLCAAAPGPVIILDGDMRILAANQPWLDWLGYASDRVTGRRVTEFMAASSASHFNDQSWRSLQTAGSIRDVSCQLIKRTGEIVETLFSVQASYGETGAVSSAVVMVVDNTERQRSEDRFSKLFAMSPTPLLVRRMDDNRILDANDAFIAMTGYSPEAVIGHSIEDLWVFASKSQRQQLDQDLRAGKRVQQIDVRMKTAPGEMLDNLVSAEPVHVFGQNCALLAFQDVTDRRRNEAQLFEAIETVMSDTTWFSRSVIEKLAGLRAPVRPGVRAPEIGDLTPREREVLGLISHGMTDTDIAEKLKLTRCTVRNHVATLYSKIGVHSRSSAIVWARERGINIAWPPSGAPGFMREAASHRKVPNVMLPPKGRGA
jgi:PAS domain S-box-containing protein